MLLPLQRPPDVTKPERRAVQLAVYTFLGLISLSAFGGAVSGGMIGLAVFVSVVCSPLTGYVAYLREYKPEALELKARFAA